MTVVFYKLLPLNSVPVHESWSNITDFFGEVRTLGRSLVLLLNLDLLDFEVFVC